MIFNKFDVKNKMFYNPRNLSVCELRSELNSRKLNTEGGKKLLADRLQEALIEEHKNFDFYALDDCVEKWTALMHYAQLNTHKLGNTDEVLAITKRYNQMVDKMDKMDKANVIDIANRRYTFKDFNSELEREVLVGLACLNLSIRYTMLGDRKITDSIIQTELYCSAMDED